MNKYILAAILGCALCGCKSKKILLTETQDVSYQDTTKTVKDTASITVTVTDKSKGTATSKTDITVEFVDSGGTVNVDAGGNIAMHGVKNLKGAGVTAAAIDTDVEVNAECNTSHKDVAKGESGNAKKNTVSEETPKQKWGDALLVWIGRLCCIAALLYMIFLYLKKKI